MKYYGIQNEVKAYINRLQDENGIFVSTATVKTINDRVESLKRSGDWSRFSLGFNDVDGDAYLTRAGVTNPLGRCEVLWFVRGMKALDLWRSMVCWPMRNYQNIGTGSTVYSLGGLGIHNGTLTNTIEWSDLGLKTFGTIAGSVVGTFRSASSSNFPMTLFAVNIRNSNNYTIGVDPLIQVGTSTNNLTLSRRGPVSNNTDNYTVRNNSGLTINSSTITPFQLYTIYSSINSNLANLSINKRLASYGQSILAQTLLPTNSSFILSDSPSSGTGDSVQQFASIFLNAPTNDAALHDLYKSTLGNGLGLP